MDTFILCLLAVTGGATMSVQAGINVQLQQHWAGSPVLAAAVSFAVGTLALLVYVLVMRIPIPPLPAKITPWHWAGGFLGAYLVSVTVYVAPRLGATTMVALVLAGQVGVSLLLDHFGLVGYAQKAVTWQRLVGVALVAGGVFLIRRF
jgi:transporter family-2 protein